MQKQWLILEKEQKIYWPHILCDIQNYTHSNWHLISVQKCLGKKRNAFKSKLWCGKFKLASQAQLAKCIWWYFFKALNQRESNNHLLETQKTKITTGTSCHGRFKIFSNSNDVETTRVVYLPSESVLLRTAVSISMWIQQKKNTLTQLGDAGESESWAVISKHLKMSAVKSPPRVKIWHSFTHNQPVLLCAFGSFDVMQKKPQKESLP